MKHPQASSPLDLRPPFGAQDPARFGLGVVRVEGVVAVEFKRGGEGDAWWGGGGCGIQEG